MVLVIKYFILFALSTEANYKKNLSSWIAKTGHQARVKEEQGKFSFYFCAAKLFFAIPITYFISLSSLGKVYGKWHTLACHCFNVVEDN